MDAEQKLAATLQIPFEIKQVRIKNFLINYLIAGDGPNLLLIHGSNIGWGQWYLNIRELAKHFKIYALDMPGAGGSTRVDYFSFDLEKDYLNVVDKFIRFLKLEKVHLMGHSIAGWAILKLALRERDYIDKIVLVNSMGFTKHLPLRYKLISIRIFAKLISKTVVSPTKKNMKRFLLSVLYRDSELNNEFIDYFYESITRDKKNISHPLLMISRFMRLFHIREELVLINKLSKIKNPTLIVFGANDPLMPLHKVQENIKKVPNHCFEIITKTGHVPSIEKHEEFNKIVIEFVKRS